ncbi:MAG: hypothetical protein K2W82_12605 [Candidatus Obscuribacterales bacterium]|jgi:hypothetical protein|nr:hypothetical protein [Candidatus Obscuribacterales bacterium]
MTTRSLSSIFSRPSGPDLESKSANEQSLNILDSWGAGVEDQVSLDNWMPNKIPGKGNEVRANQNNVISLDFASADDQIESEIEAEAPEQIFVGSNVEALSPLSLIYNNLDQDSATSKYVSERLSQELGRDIKLDDKYSLLVQFDKNGNVIASASHPSGIRRTLIASEDGKITQRVSAGGKEVLVIPPIS